MMQNKSFAVTGTQAVPAGPSACQLELESLVLCVKSLVLCWPATVGSATVTQAGTVTPVSTTAAAPGLASLTPPARPGSRGAGAGLTQAQ